MIGSLYDTFKHWSDGGSVYIISDLHFEGVNCKKISIEWPEPLLQVKIINEKIKPNDTLICLGDVGEGKYINQIRAKKKILLLGNHDKRSQYVGQFDEIYTGPLFISDKILLSHEPIIGLPWCLNIHGHDHNAEANFPEDCKHINLAANVCGYTPVNLGEVIKGGILAKIDTIHRMTIDRAVQRKSVR